MHILQIRDKNGNFVPIKALKGDDGKSAYVQAKEGGYKGTEEEFVALLNGLISSEAAAHCSDFDNPHKVTAKQTGALPVTGGEMEGSVIADATTSADLSLPQVRNIYAGSGDLVAGSSLLGTGWIYLVYE